MGKRDPKRVQKRHGERLAHLRTEMSAGRYHMALVLIGHILGDLQLPPQTRAEITLTKVEALLGLGRTLEATVSFTAVLKCITRHGLIDMRGAVNRLADKLAEAQAVDVGGVGY